MNSRVAHLKIVLHLKDAVSSYILLYIIYLYYIDVLPLIETLHIQFTQQVVENVGIACSAEFEIRLM